ncbi:EAL domain-containing protein [Kineococcus gynurae]|uniref:EAL domain-containing protein n=1 Tax=Kineococcus gynurae TaxID=452979 RepID=A0ABV5LTU7_9ACTN
MRSWGRSWSRRGTGDGVADRETLLAALTPALISAGLGGTPLTLVRLEVGVTVPEETPDLTARLLALAADPAALLARLGGEEFALLLPGRTDGEAVALLDRLGDLPVTAGIAQLVPGEDRATLLRRARAARPGDVATGRPTPRVGVADLERTRLAADLARTLRGAPEQIEVRHRPVVDLHDGRVLAVEASWHWEHPTRGALAPAEVPLTVEAAVEVGHLVLGRACADVVRLRAVTPDLHLHLTLPPGHLGTGASGAVLDTCEATGLPPHALLLGVPETTLVRPRPALLEELGRLREAGVRIAITDVGTATPLGALDALPLDELHLGPALTAPVVGSGHRVEVVRAVVELGTALGLTLLATGVDSAPRAAVLRALGCGRAAGDLFAHPEPVVTVLQRLALEDSRSPAAAALGGPSRP